MVINFYKFIALDDTESLKTSHLIFCKNNNILGTILLAHEGINAGLSGTPESLARYQDFLRQDPRFQDVIFKTSHARSEPYKKLYIKIKPAIVTFTKSQDPSPEVINSAPRLSPEEFRQMVLERKNDIVLVDTRNDYETDWGTFDGAATLPIKTFSQFPDAFTKTYQDQKDKTFLMFCTGGIRCEKAVPWAIAQGFKHSYQLDGGIITYMRQFGHDLFKGECFVFDNRWALTQNLDEADQPSLAEKVLQPKPQRL